MIISDTAVKKSTTVSVLALLLIIFGVYCYKVLPEGERSRYHHS